ncbi:MAG TPA: hypothetical protein VK636_11085 [Gemmatimonadaceae bacterium]|nr:hypothetical protein [Gemmatimonadaceae bacterium]
MIDRPRVPIGVVAVRIGRTELGQGAVTIDDDALTIVVRDGAGERPIRLRLVAIDSAILADGELTVAVRDGSRITLESPSAPELHDIILAHCRALPELTRALRSFGSRRGSRAIRASGPSEQQRFFAPLLDARRQAVAVSTPSGVLDAFEATPLASAMERAILAFAAERAGPEGPARRALEAELVDLSEPLEIAFARLRAAAERASALPDDLPAWRSWSNELRATFEVADRVWLTLDTALDGASLAP